MSAAGCGPVKRGIPLHTIPEEEAVVFSPVTSLAASAAAASTAAMGAAPTMVRPLATRVVQPVPSSANGESAAGAGAEAPKPKSPFRQFVEAVVEDGTAQCYKEGAIPDCATTQPALPCWTLLEGGAKKGFQRALEVAVESVFDSQNRYELLESLKIADSSRLAAPSEAFPNRKVMPDTIGAFCTAVKEGLAAVFKVRIISHILDYARGYLFQYSIEEGQDPSCSPFVFWNPAARAYGMFAGSGGGETALEAGNLFPRLFATELAKSKGNAPHALKLAAHATALKVKDSPSSAAAAAVHIDKHYNAHFLMIGTIYVHLYRKIGGVVKCIHPALICDWSTKSELERAATAAVQIVQSYPEYPIPGNIVAIVPGCSITNSRGIGGSALQCVNQKPLVISKPAVSCYPRLQPGDVILILTDNLETVPRFRDWIIKLIEADVENLAEVIAKKAAEVAGSDTTAAICLKISC